VKFKIFEVNYSNLPAGRQVIFEALDIVNVRKFLYNLAKNFRLNRKGIRS